MKDLGCEFLAAGRFLGARLFTEGFSAFLAGSGALLYCASGAVELSLDGKPVCLGAGSAVAAGENCAVRFIGGQGFTLYALLCELCGVRFKSGVFALDCREQCERLIAGGGDAFFAVLAKSAVGAKHTDDISAALCAIRLRYAEGLCVKQLAAECGKDRAYFSRLFKARTGVTALEYLTNVRLAAAEQYLQKGESVESTARLCGFTSPSTFISLFKKHKGITPKKYALAKTTNRP